MIYFNSDYLEGAHPALMAKLNETNMVQPDNCLPQLHHN